MNNSTKIHTFALVALLTLSAYLLADTVDAMIGRSLDAAPKFTGPMTQERSGIAPRKELSDYSTILERGLFGEGRASSSGPAAAVESSAYVLIGTVEGEQFAGAVLEDAAKVQAFYRIDQKLPDGSQLVKVKRDRVVIRRPDGGTFEVQIVDDTKIVNLSSRGPAGTGVRKVGD